MSASLRNICFQLWKPMYERKGIHSDFRPVFIRYIGVENTHQYDDVLKTLAINVDTHKNKTLCFDREIPLGEGKIISYFSKQLEGLNIQQISVEDVALFDNETLLNQMYVEALNYVIRLAKANEHFFNENVERNFVKKLIVWSYLHLRSNHIVLTDSVNPTCVYYGEITRHEIYFLILLYKIGFDVIYINPLKEEFWEDIDRERLSEQHKNSQILPVFSLKQRAEQGKEISQLETATLALERNLEETLFLNGVYKPWQFRGYYTEPIFINGTIMDLQNNFRQPAKVRNGFSVKERKVSIPYFFQKIEGEYEDFKKYSELVQYIVLSEHVLFLNDGGGSLLPESLSRNDMLSLTFCMAGDGTCIPEKIKNLSFYPLSRYKEEVQNLILEKANECLLDHGLFQRKFNKEERLEFLMLILHLHEKIIRMIDNFDYPNQIPKIVFFLNNEDKIPDEILYILGFLSKIGMDILIFDPSGMFNPHNVLRSERMNIIRLDTMRYERNYSDIKNKQKKNCFLKKCFGNIF